MAESDHTQGRASAHKRPSLIDPAAKATASQPALSVLAALDGKRPVAAGRARRRAMPWIAGVGAMALVTLSVFAWTMRVGESPQPGATVDRGIATTAQDRIAAMPASAPPPVGGAAGEQRAGLENLPAASSEPAPVAAAPQMPAAAPTVARAAQPKLKSERPKDKDRRLAKTSTRRTAAKSPPSPGPSRVTPDAPRADADVDLIAALMQHMSPAPTAGKDGATTIADLVAKCRMKHGAEAQRCQRRICENYWGRAEACPRSAAPAGQP